MQNEIRKLQKWIKIYVLLDWCHLEKEGKIYKNK